MWLKIIPPTGHKIYLSDLFRAGSTRSIDGFWFNSGTAALYFLLSTLKIPPSSHILIPAYTCPAVASAVLKAGHKPVLCDINRECLDFELDELKEKIRNYYPSAIVWVNLFGLVKKIPELGIPIILDNAQVAPFSVSFNRVKGTVFSFGRGKPVNSLGGGMALIQQPEVFKTQEFHYEQIPAASFLDSIIYVLNIVAYKVFYHPQLYKIPTRLPGLHLGETIFYPNFNICKPTRINQSCICNIMNRFEQIQMMRRSICNRYNSFLRELSPIIKTFGTGIFYRFPLIICDARIRNRVIKGLEDMGIVASRLYPVPLNRQAGLAEILKDSTEYSNAEFISRNLLTLPVNEFVTEEVMAKIKKVFIKVLN